VCACVDEETIEACNQNNILLLGPAAGGLQGVIPASWPENLHLLTVTKQ